MRSRSTHPPRLQGRARAYIIIGVSRQAYDEIADTLRAAGYNDAFDGETIDMRGLALAPPEDQPT